MNRLAPLAAAAVMALAFAACTSGGSPPQPAAPSPTAAPSVEMTATPAPMWEATPPVSLSLQPGESVRVSAEPFPAARMSEVRERLPDERLDDHRSSLLYDRDEDRLYLIEGVYSLCFLPAGVGGRMGAIATTGIPTDGGGAGRSLLVLFDPFEVLVLNVRLHAACWGEPLAGAAPRSVVVSAGPDTQDGATVPLGKYSFDPVRLELTLIHVVPRDGLIERWTNTQHGAPLELVSEGGDTRLIDTTFSKVLLADVGSYEMSPDGQLLAINGRRPDSDVTAFHVVVIGSLSVVGAGGSPPTAFAWSPDNRWLAASWADPVVEHLASTYVLEIMEEFGGFGFETAERIGPVADRWVQGWVGPGALLLATASYPDRALEILEVPGGSPKLFARIPRLLGRQLSPDGAAIATSAASESFAIYDFGDETRFVPSGIEGVSLGIVDFSWSPDGRWLAAWRSPGRS